MQTYLLFVRDARSIHSTKINPRAVIFFAVFWKTHTQAWNDKFIRYRIKYIKHQHLQIQAHKQPYHTNVQTVRPGPTRTTPLVLYIQRRNEDQQRRAVITIVLYLDSTWGLDTITTSHTASNTYQQHIQIQTCTNTNMHMHLLFVHGQYVTTHI